jgi:hypothetical protein
LVAVTYATATRPSGSGAAVNSRSMLVPLLLTSVAISTAPDQTPAEKIAAVSFSSPGVSPVRNTPTMESAAMRFTSTGRGASKDETCVAPGTATAPLHVVPVRSTHR